MATQKKKKSAVVEPKVLTLSNYRNTSSNNIFTESGRVAPGGLVALLPDQAKAYDELEKCPS